MKTYAPVLALLVVNVVLVVAVRTRWNPPAARPSFELLNQVVNLRPPLRRPASTPLDAKPMQQAASPLLEGVGAAGWVVQSPAASEDAGKR